MSSSRRSSPSRRARRALCPTCGSARVAEVCEAVVLRIRGVRHRFIDVPHERCEDCGERIFSLETSRLFDAAVLRRRRKRAA